MWPEIRRKIFHLGSIMYVIGLIYVPRSLYLALLLSAAVLVFGMELLRMKSPRFQASVRRIAGPLMRAHEERRFSGLFWMLLGVTITVFLLPPVPVAAAALLYLILGDAAASLVGIRFGGPHWPGRPGKRISGSLACLAVCLFIGQVLLRPEYGWTGVVAGAVAAVAAEMGFVPLDDNVTIPVASSLVLMLSYGLTPGF